MASSFVIKSERQACIRHLNVGFSGGWKANFVPAMFQLIFDKYLPNVGCWFVQDSLGFLASSNIALLNSGNKYRTSVFRWTHHGSPVTQVNFDVVIPCIPGNAPSEGDETRIQTNHTSLEWMFPKILVPPNHPF